MNKIEDRLKQTLHNIARQLRDVGLQSHSEHIELLANQVSEPCVVAVVGRINAGKSTFINAFLGDDLAKVGSTETTATINCFLYGRQDTDWPVRCHWRNNTVTLESRQFLDDLQDTSIEALQRSRDIDYLEYWLQNETLRSITLVDTPGTGAVEQERQRRTEEFLNLYRQQREARRGRHTGDEATAFGLYNQLREAHQRETQRIGSQADAIIYVVERPPGGDAKAFLNEFHNVAHGTSGSALNAIGVLAKMDYSEEMVRQREALAQDIAGQLREELNTVIPISAGLQQALDNLLAHSKRGLAQLIAALRPLPPETMDILLASQDGYQYVDPPTIGEQWKQLQGEMLWPVFTTIVRTIIDHPDWNTSMLEKELRAITGFDQVNAILKRHFIRRASYLHCHRIVHDVLEIRKDVRFTQLDMFQRLDEANRAKRDRFLSFIHKKQDDPTITKELAAFVNQHLAPRTPLLQAVINAMEEINKLNQELEDDNEDFEALVHTEDHPELFSKLLSNVILSRSPEGVSRSPERSEGEWGSEGPAELHELQRLLGLYGTNIEDRIDPVKMTRAYLEEKQRFWHNISEFAAHDTVRTVAERAVRRYGIINNSLPK